MNKIIETDRLLLRTWTDRDLQPMLAINQDPKVMEYFSGLQDLEATTNFITKVNKHFDKHCYSLYATIRKDTSWLWHSNMLVACKNIITCKCHRKHN